MSILSVSVYCYSMHGRQKGEAVKLFCPKFLRGFNPYNLHTRQCIGPTLLVAPGSNKPYNGPDSML